MPFTIFYSWQSKTEKKYNLNFIEDCLKAAIRELKKELKDDSQEFYIDRDTKDVSGIPNIPTTLEGKIKICDVFLADLTFIKPVVIVTPPPKRTFWDKVFMRPQQNPVITEEKEGIPAPNVSQELGLALGSTTTEARIITVLNESYGLASKLPFDLVQRRFPVTYSYDPSTTPEEKAEAKKKLVKSLKEIVTVIYQTEHERQKAHFYPFETWKTWEQSITIPFPFERTNYLKDVFGSIRNVINNPREVFRFCGLPGIGKTRILFECFKDNGIDNIGDLTGKVLYVDTKEQEDRHILDTVKQLLQQGEDKILIVDNCTQNYHIELARLVNNKNSQLKLITVSSNPEERLNELDTEQQTRLIILQSVECKETVSRILYNNFSDLEDAEKEVLVEFASGIPFVATLMINNKERGKYQPGSLHPTRVVQRLLGPLYDDEQVRAVIVACSLFSQIGFFDDLAEQADVIASQEDLCSFSLNGINPEDVTELKKKKFRQICETLYEHQLLERKGRMYALRPSPLAVRMAEDWWKNCTMAKFNRILPFLQNGRLIESFCEQFRYLKHVDHAQIIVKDLCDGFFNRAEVLNTAVGSRLFRSFVYVNPIACAQALIAAFQHFTVEELVEIKEGRRNLIWALEKLCFRQETFEESVKIMAAFAIGENEHLANNATKQFLQLFHVHLPGTVVDLNARWEIIEYCLAKGAGYDVLAFQAIKSAMKVDHFHRMGGAEDQGDVTALRDFQPSNAQIISYWENCIGVLIRYVQSDHPLAITGAQILLDNFYAFCTVGVGNLILPAIELFLANNLVDRMEVRKKVKFILSSKRVYNPAVLTRLQAMLDTELVPAGFGDKFEILVKQPGYDEYFPDRDIVDRGSALMEKIDLLAREFLGAPNQWIENSRYFIEGNIQEGYSFGKALAKNATSKQLDEIVSGIRLQMKELDTSSLNVTVLIGILANLQDGEQFERLFHEILEDNQLKNISFSIARVKELRFEDLLLLINLTDNRHFSTNLFGTFIHGWGLRHLSPTQVEEILTRLDEIDEMGKCNALMILVTWSHQDQEVWDTYSALIRRMILNNSSVFFTHLNHAMDVHYYGEAVIKLLKGKGDQELAQFTTSLIIEQINKMEQYYSIDDTIYKFLDILQEEYFNILWEDVLRVFQDASQFGIAAWHLKDLLGSHHDHERTTEGLLFKGNTEKFAIIYDWCRNHLTDSAVLWLAELLPIFNNERANADDWHPYARTFIDTMGDNYNVLSSIDAKMGTYSWVGTIIPKLESDKLLFEKLLDHPKQTVREWAKVHVESLDRQIKVETDREIDGFMG